MKGLNFVGNYCCVVKFVGSDGNGVQDVIETVVGKVRGFGKSGDGDFAAGAIGLKVGSLQCFVCLDVGSQVAVELLGFGRHVNCIGLRDFQVHYVGGGAQSGDGLRWSGGCGGCGVEKLLQFGFPIELDWIGGGVGAGCRQKVVDGCYGRGGDACCCEN